MEHAGLVTNYLHNSPTFRMLGREKPVDAHIAALRGKVWTDDEGWVFMKHLADTNPVELAKEFGE